MKVFKNFWNLLDRKNKQKFFFIAFLILMQTILELFSIALIIPFVSIILDTINISQFKRIIDLNFLLEVPKDTLLIFSSLLLIFVFAIKNLVIIFSTKKIFQFVYDLRTFFYQNLLKKFMHQNYLFFVKENFSKIGSLLGVEVQNLAIYYYRPVIFLVTEIIILISILALIIIFGYYDIFLILVPAGILATLILKYNNNKIKLWSNQRAELEREQIGLSYRFVNGIKEILLTGYIKDILQNFKKLMSGMASVETKINAIQAIPKGLLEFLAILIFSLSLIYLNYINYNSSEIIVILSFYLAAAYRIIPSLNKIFVSYQQLKFGKPSYNTLEYYFKLSENAIFNEKIHLESEDFYKKKIILKNIEFDYPGREKLFKNENFEIEKFDKIGIYGDSGSGKSTLLNIITFLIQPESIELSVDGIIYKNKNQIRSYQNLFSYISQDTFLTNDSIKQNILLGSDSNIFDNKKFNEALKFAKLDNFVDTIPNGIETNIGESLKTISSGQRQRIAIARLYYSSRQILILDEATNAIDAKNETEIINNIMRLKNKTIIIVSHNTDNLNQCDKIYKIKENKIIKEK